MLCIVECAVIIDIEYRYQPSGPQSSCNRILGDEGDNDVTPCKRDLVQPIQLSGRPLAAAAMCD